MSTCCCNYLIQIPNICDLYCLSNKLILTKNSLYWVKEEGTIMPKSMKWNHIFHILTSLSNTIIDNNSLATENNTSQARAHRPHISPLATKAKRKESSQNAVIGVGSKINFTNH